jgi:hypothetical protein
MARKEETTMFIKNNLMCIALFNIILCSTVFAQTNEPVILQCKWKPGETLTYKATVVVDAKAVGENMKMEMEMEISVYTLPEQQAVYGFQDISGEALESSPSLSIGEKLTDVEIYYSDDMKMKIVTAGTVIEVIVGKQTIKAYVNGNAIPSYELGQLQNDMKPLQDLLSTTIRASITDEGKVVRVSGLENLDATTQKELAMAFLEGIMLPGKPMNIGDSFSDKRSLANLFPSQPGQKDNPLAERTVEIIRTLESLDYGSNGKVVAKLTAPLRLKLNDIPIDEEGNQGSVDIDMKYTTLVDVNRGVITKETAIGTILIYPKAAYMPDVITMKLNAIIALVESSNPISLLRR